jgi:predicted nucleic acid-binding Zn ribbon protein
VSVETGRAHREDQITDKRRQRDRRMLAFTAALFALILTVELIVLLAR